MTAAPRFSSALDTSPDTRQAVARAADAALAELGATPDLAVLFFSPHHAEQAEDVAAIACDKLGCEQLIGCTGESIVGRGREVEGEPAVSLWLAHLPGTTVMPFALQLERTPEGGTLVGWPADLPETWPAGTGMLLIGEPFSFPADFLLERLNEDRPGVPVVGGMASGGFQPGTNRLLLGRQVLDEGALAVLIWGAVRLRGIVSQGCRPIGRPLVVTKAQRNVIEELGGKPALLQLQDIFNELPTSEQQLVQQGVHVGRVVNEYQERFEAGDFLVRNVIGVDRENGAIAVGDYFRAGQTVQFHVRDGRTADDDLRQVLASARGQMPASPAGGLLFTCNGRGTRLFDGENHDALCVRDALGDIPLAGFFAQGELGPVGGKNFMHGFTASLALLESTG